jgi:hypothetical protein
MRKNVAGSTAGHRRGAALTNPLKNNLCVLCGKTPALVPKSADRSKLWQSRGLPCAAI